MYLQSPFFQVRQYINKFQEWGEDTFGDALFEQTEYTRTNKKKPHILGHTPMTRLKPSHLESYTSEEIRDLLPWDKCARDEGATYSGTFTKEYQSPHTLGIKSTKT